MPSPKLVLLFMAAAVGACAPPELTAPQEELVRRCLEMAHKQETSPECVAITRSMEKAFLRKRPDFYERLVADRVAYVEERIAEDMRRRDELNQCLDDHEVGRKDAPSCEDFMTHEIMRGLQERRLARCVAARLDGAAADADCQGLPERLVEDELHAERARRARRR
ncbi:MAG TPA: hypothetical protein VK025_15365 [Steroidobacter sp.]|jgi:hypothetical protein|nr:hypothetical protein [Steroidobacteraceae bacterium]HLS82778.1 hypothetical protein [Steroidobacter sp.]